MRRPKRTRAYQTHAIHVVARIGSGASGAPRAAAVQRPVREDGATRADRKRKRRVDVVWTKHWLQAYERREKRKQEKEEARRGRGWPWCVEWLAAAVLGLGLGWRV